MKNNKKVEDILFLIKDVLKVNVLTFAEIFSKFDITQFEEMIKDAQAFADDELAPFFKDGSQTEAVGFNLGHVKMPTGHVKAWESFRNSDWFSILASTPQSGKYIPDSIKLPLMELFMSADLSFGLNVMQTAEAARILDPFKENPSIEKLYKPVFSGLWTAAIASRNLQYLDTPDQITLTAQAKKDHFTVSGQEKFLMGGDQNLAENILYIIPAKVQTDKKGTEKIGLFAIPKIQLGNSKQHNSVVVDHYHDSTGLAKLPMCDVSFGQIGETQGHLITTLEPGSKIIRDLLSTQQAYSIITSGNILELAHHLILDIADKGTDIPGSEELKARVDTPSNMESFLKIHALQKGLKGACYHMMFFKDCAKHGAPAQQQNFENLVDFYQSVIKPYATDSGSQILGNILSILGEVGATNFFPIEQFLRDLIVSGNIGGNNITLNHDMVSNLLKKDEGAVFKSFISDIEDIDPQNAKSDPLKQAIMEWQDYLGGAFLLQDELQKDEEGENGLGVIYANRVNHLLGALMISGSLVRQGIAAEAQLTEMGANMLHLKQEAKRDDTVKELYEKLLIAEFFASHILSQEESTIRAIQKKSAGVIADFFS